MRFYILQNQMAPLCDRALESIIPQIKQNKGWPCYEL